jgi:hypothetical protein
MVRELPVDACLAEIRQIWLNSPEESRPELVWIALHGPIPRDTSDPETPVLRAWLLDRTGLNEKQAIEYVRFIAIHSGKGWASGASGPPSGGIFNSGQGRVHTIGLAAFAAVEESDLIYLHHIFGGTSGRGALYGLSKTSGRLECAQNLWLS